MGRRIKVALAGLVAVAVVGCGAVVASATDTTAPAITAGTGTCTTNTSGMCTLPHTLGQVPDTVVVSAVATGTQKPFILNTVAGSYTATDFKVRAMTNATTPKSGASITVSWVASKGAVAPPPPPSTSTTPPTSTTSSTTVAPPPSTSTTVTPPPTTTTAPPAGGCAAPTKIVEQDGATFDAPGTGGQYYVHNDAWNWQGHSAGQYEYLYLCNYNNWYVDSWGFKSAQGEVFMYPSTKWDATTAGCCAGRLLSTWPNTFSGRFAGTTNDVWKTSGSYDVAWDLWLNGVADNNSLELMVWTEKAGNADPAGTQRGTFTAADGHVYDVWWDGAQKGGYLAFISQTPQPSGTVDLRAMITYASAKGYLPAGTPTVNQVNYGIEVRDSGTATSASPARFTLTDFALTMN